MSKAILDQITRAQLLVSGLKKNFKEVESKGMNEKIISQIEANYKLLHACNKELDKLKEDLRVQIHKTNVTINELKNQVRNAKKVVKNNFSKEEWPRFGVNDKR